MNLVLSVFLVKQRTTYYEYKLYSIFMKYNSKILGSRTILLLFLALSMQIFSCSDCKSSKKRCSDAATVGKVIVRPFGFMNGSNCSTNINEIAGDFDTFGSTIFGKSVSDKAWVAEVSLSGICSDSGADSFIDYWDAPLEAVPSIQNGQIIFTIDKFNLRSGFITINIYEKYHDMQGCDNSCERGSLWYTGTAAFIGGPIPSNTSIVMDIPVGGSFYKCK